MPTQQGVDAFQGTPRRSDGDFARMFLATGVIPLGKTQLSEFGFSPSAEHERLGPVRSPWDPDYTAGASSAGSAAMVAAGVVPLAHANDGGGSIRIPASVNGLVGLKPTRGRLAQDRTLRQMPVQIVSDGVVTRSVRDTAAFFRESEKVYRNLRLPPVGDITRPGKARLRVAVVTEGVGARGLARGRRPDPEDRRAARGARPHRRAHRPARAGVLPRRLPPLLVDAEPVHSSQTGRRTFGDTWDPDLLDNLTHGLARHSRRNLHKLPLAIARLRRSGRISARLYREYDVVLTPTLATSTPRVGHLAAEQRLRDDPRADAGLGGVHPAAERHRRPGDQPPPDHDRRRDAARA